ncbi:MAG: lytic transglycosylase domain-containing protein [Tannerella sp.]|nr:lytic transglycosylase domain-containing protein [Tannerella sp.]
MNFFSVCVCCLVVYLLFGYKDSVAVKEKTPVVSSFTVSPEVPSSVRFCGKEIDLTRYNMWEGMDRELSGFTYFHSSTMLLIKRANRYFPIIEPILAANDVPDDFKYLAVIESHLDPKATSSARAAGMWQFLEGTGKQYGLRVTATVDERRHVAKSTEAACKYLKEAYAKYGDWLTVASSYNAGMERISSRMEKQQESSVLDLYLVEETTRYPYRILAIKQIFENPYKYGFVLKPGNLYRPIHCKVVPVNEDIPDLAVFARQHNITYRDLKDFNPWLKDTKLAIGNGKYEILIPNKDALYYNSPNRYVHDRRWVVD